MNDNGFKGSPMGGWLVIFIAMYVISAAQGVIGLWPAVQAAMQMPKFAGAFLAIVAVIGIWKFLFSTVSCRSYCKSRTPFAWSR